MSQVRAIDDVADVLDFMRDVLSAIPPSRDHDDQAEALAWRESAEPAEVFPAVFDRDTHKSFALAAPSTAWGPVESSRVMRGEGGEVTTTVEVRWAFALTVDLVGAYRDALRVERQLFDALRRYHDIRKGGIRIRVQSASRLTGVPEGEDVAVAWVMGTITCAVDHRYLGWGP